MKFELSICIPTYNRAEFLRESLEALATQVTGAVEVVVVDGASTDATEHVVLESRNLFPHFTFYQRTENAGVDADVLKAIELARGDYCWLMSDDDLIADGAIEKILRALIRRPDLTGISVNTAAYDSSMTYEVKAVPAISGGKIAKDYLFTDEHAAFQMLGVHFGYLSGQIINRRLWLTVVSKQDLREFHNCWLLVFVIGKMLQYRARWLYIHGKYVKYRSGNDSFKGRMGIVGRQQLTHDEFARVIAALFGAETPTYRSVLHTVLVDRMARSLAVLKADGLPIKDQFALGRMYVRRYWMFPALWGRVMPIFLVPNFAFSGVRFIYFKLCSRKAKSLR